MRIAVVGTVVCDRIVYTDGREIHSLGGIHYTVAVAAHLCPPDWEILPICRIGRDALPAVLDAWGEFPNVRRDGIRPAARPNTRVTLLYRKPTEREEYTTLPMAPLGTEELYPALSADVCVINFITGSDVKLAALRFLRESYRGMLYLDIHSLTLGIAPDGQRYYRYPRRWREYARAADCLQLNEYEAACLAQLRPDERTLEALRSFAVLLLSNLSGRLRLVNLTLGERGSLMACRGRDGSITCEHVPGLRVSVVDPTGCGDTYAIAFLVRYIATGDPLEAAYFANTIAGHKCTLAGSEGLAELGHAAAAANASSSRLLQSGSGQADPLFNLTPPRGVG